MKILADDTPVSLLLTANNHKASRRLSGTYWLVGWSVKGNLSERVFLFETFIVLSPKNSYFLIDNRDLVVLKVVGAPRG
jgi:hypothetical protein